MLLVLSSFVGNFIYKKCFKKLIFGEAIIDSFMIACIYTFLMLLTGVIVTLIRATG